MAVRGLLLLAIFETLLLAQTPGSLTGRVLDARTNAPLAGVRVVARKLDAPETKASHGTRTNEEGVYLFPALEAGGYVLHFERAGYIKSNSQFALRKIRVVTGETSKEAEFLLFEQSVLLGRVLDSDGDPVDKAEVTVTAWNRNGYALRTQTDDEGRFRAAGLIGGPYLVAANPGSSSALAASGEPTLEVRTYFPSTTEADSASVVHLEQGETREGIEIRVRRVPAIRIAGQISGFPEGATGAGLELYRVADSGVSFVNRAEPVRRIHVERPGSFELSMVPTGEYDLVAKAWNGPASAIGILRLRAGAAGLDGLSIPMRPYAKVEARIRWDGAPVKLPQRAFWAISHQPLYFTGVFGTTETEGTARFERLGPTVYTLTSGRAEGWYVKSVLLNGRPQRGLAIDPTNGGDLEIQLSSRPAAIRGKVAIPAGYQGHAEACLFPDGVQGPELAHRFRSVPATTGSFEFASVAPGKYKLAVVSTGLNPRVLSPGFLDRLGAKVYEVLTEEGVTTTVDARLVEVKDVDPN
ncbi:MAG: hypothetical protein FJW30_06745 [Acidobacteria bacterium]|nr:hypothetical protein [Acidobacteriota bacterium]